MFAVKRGARTDPASLFVLAHDARCDDFFYSLLRLLGIVVYRLAPATNRAANVISGLEGEPDDNSVLARPLPASAKTTLRKGLFPLQSYQNVW